MAPDPDRDRPKEPAKTSLGPQSPLPLAERRRLSQPAKRPETKDQIFTDWAMI